MSTPIRPQLDHPEPWGTLAIQTLHTLAASVAMMCAWRFSRFTFIPLNDWAVGLGWISFGLSLVAFICGTVLAVRAVRAAPSTTGGTLGVMTTVLVMWTLLLSVSLPC